MGQWIVRRLCQVPPTLLIISVVVFVLVRASGDPVDAYLPLEAPESLRQEMREQLGLDEPLPIQYLRFVSNAMRGDFGISMTHRRPALEVALERLPATLQLAMAALGLACGMGFFLGVISAARVGSRIDTTIFGVATLLQSVPQFWVGIMLIWFFAVELRLLPTSGSGGWTHLLMPAVTQSLYLLPRVLLFTRSSILEVAGESYMVVARAKGLTERMLMTRHVIKNAMGSPISFVGLSVGRMMGGAVITEKIFAWPGLGRLALDGVFRRDLAVVQATTFTIAIVIILASLAVDLVLAYLDPRIRSS